MDGGERRSLRRKVDDVEVECKTGAGGECEAGRER